MNRLELCQTVQGLLRAATGQLTTTPATTVGTVQGVDGEIIRWVDYAYRDIQNDKEEWLFRVSRDSINTVVGQRTYDLTTAAPTFERLLPSMAQSDTPFLTNYKTADGVGNEIRMWQVPYEMWQHGIFDSGIRPQARPVRYTVNPAGTISLDPEPDDIYTIIFDFRRSLHTMTADADEPIIPARYHMAIVWWAMRYYCITRGSPQDYRAGVELEISREMHRLYVDQLQRPLFVDDTL